MKLTPKIIWNPVAKAAPKVSKLAVGPMRFPNFTMPSSCTAKLANIHSTCNTLQSVYHDFRWRNFYLTSSNSKVIFASLGTSSMTVVTTILIGCNKDHNISADNYPLVAGDRIYAKRSY